MDRKALIEERVKLYEENKALLDKASAAKRTLNSEEQAEFDKRDARINEIRETLDRAAKLDAEEKALAESRGRQTETKVVSGGGEITARDRDLALRAWALAGRGKHITPDMVASCQRVGLDPSMPEIEMRALSVGTTDAGGYSVPDEMMRAYWEKLKWFGNVRGLATVLSTATGAALPIPTVDDTSNVGEIIGEAAAVTTTADPIFGQIVLDAYKYSSKAVIVSVELLQDSSINVPVLLGGLLGTRIGRIQNTHFTVGTGSSQPNGVMVAASTGKTAAAANAFTLDEVIDLYHSVDLAYRNAPGAGFMMNDSVAAVVRKFKDSNNQYLWQMAVQEGQPDRLFGRPVYINNDVVGTLATGNRIMAYGDFRAYHVRDAGPVIFARADELRILNHQVVFLAFQRSDGDLVDTGAVKRLVLA